MILIGQMPWFHGQTAMPLHLLGKKSWNVYNADNIARVRRDEAAAKAAEEAEEQRMQEIDAQRRLAILRGEQPPPPSTEEDENKAAVETVRARPGAGSERPPRRKRKREGEDDTDFELRLARERAEPAGSALEVSHKPSSSAPIVDHRGHIDLFGDEKTRAHAEKNEEAEREAQKKKREFEDQFTMRLANAAGKDGIKRPWYWRGDADGQTLPLKDIWGKDDPRRKQRDAERIAANDPLAIMRKGASRVRELKRERRKIQEERDNDLRQLQKEDAQEERHRRKHGGESRSRHRSASPDSSRRRRRSRERKDDGHERGRNRDRDRDRGRRRHEHLHHSDRRDSRPREERHRRHRETT
ncbi:hypothetical protein E4U55_004173 [Claviceps digitariae]|nr:hypothetical protein E4U55_004173 [Claviceps digitariae]